MTLHPTVTTQRFFGVPGHPGKFVYGPFWMCKKLEELFLPGVISAK